MTSILVSIPISTPSLQRRLNQAAAEVGAWIGNSIPLFYMDVITCPYFHLNKFIFCYPQNTEGCHEANMIVTNGTTGYRYENLWCPSGRRCWQHGGPRYSVVNLETGCNDLNEIIGYQYSSLNNAYHLPVSLKLFRSNSKFSGICNAFVHNICSRSQKRHFAHVTT